MARLLGGTSTYAQPEAGINNQVFNENPDQPAALQRRFNYFDYLANGQLKGGITLGWAQDAGQHPAAPARLVRDRRSAEGLGQRLPASAPGSRNLAQLADLAAEVHVRAAVGDHEVSQHLADSVRCQQEHEARDGLALLLAFGGRCRQRDDGNPHGRDGHGQRTDRLGLHGSSPARIVLDTVNHERDTDHAHVGTTPTTTSTTATTTSTTPVTASTTLPSSTRNALDDIVRCPSRHRGDDYLNDGDRRDAVVTGVILLANAQSASANSPNNLAPPEPRRQ